MPPKSKKSKPEMTREANEHYKTLFEPGEVATMSVSAGLSRIKDALAVPPEPEPQLAPPAPAPAPPPPEPDLGPGAADWLGAMLMGGPAAVEALQQQQQQQQQQPPLPGFGNLPPVQAPPGLPSLIEYGPIPPPEKRPVGRPRSSSTGPKPPPPVKVAADALLREALIGTGFPYRMFDHVETYLAIFRDVAQRTAGMRRPGAAARKSAATAP
jgi:hypothetical protein